MSKDDPEDPPFDPPYNLLYSNVYDWLVFEEPMWFSEVDAFVKSIPRRYPQTKAFKMIYEPGGTVTICGYKTEESCRYFEGKYEKMAADILKRNIVEEH